jgi:hypothetical protein
VSAAVGRALQLHGLLLLPIGLGMGMFRNNVAIEVRLLFIGGAIFLIGWLLSKKSQV